MWPLLLSALHTHHAELVIENSNQRLGSEIGALERPHDPYRFGVHEGATSIILLGATCRAFPGVSGSFPLKYPYRLRGEINMLCRNFCTRMNGVPKVPVAVNNMKKIVYYLCKIETIQNHKSDDISFVITRFKFFCMLAVTTARVSWLRMTSRRAILVIQISQCSL